MSAPKIRAQDFLSQIPLFQGLSEYELDNIAAATTQVRAGRGDVLFKQGDPCHGFHHVVYGQVKLLLRSSLGGEKVVRLIGPGKSFGEALMFMGKPDIVTSRVLENPLLRHIANAGWVAQLDDRPVLARRMIASLSQR